MTEKLETLKTLGMFLLYYAMAITLSISVASAIVLYISPSALQVAALFLCYNLWWFALVIPHLEMKVSLPTLRTLGAVTPIMWFTLIHLQPNAASIWAYNTDIVSTRWGLVKTVVMYPEVLTNYQISYLVADTIALVLFAVAIAPIVRGEKFEFFVGGNKGSGRKDTTARLADARWATKQEIEREYSAPGGIVLGETTNPRTDSPNFTPKNIKSWGKQGKGRLITLDPEIGNGHVLVVSESSGFKTAGLVIPNLLTYRGPTLTLDPKNYLFDATAPARREMGFKPMSISHDDGIDPLRILKPLMEEYPSVFFHLAENLIPEGPHSTENSKYFRDRGLDLLSGLLYHFVEQDDPDVLKSISVFLSMPIEQMLKNAVVLGESSEHEFVRNPLKRLQAVDSKGFESLVRSISNKFKFAEYPDVKGFIHERPGGTKYKDVLKPTTDIYINVPSRVLKSFSPMVHLLLASILTATQLKETPERPTARRLLILDEAKGLGNMDVLELIRDEGRAVGLHLMMIYQTWGQLKNVWGPDAASAWEDSVDARIIGATQDSQKAMALQNIIGKDTLRIRTNSSSRSQRDLEMRGQSSSSYSEQMREAPLITTAEIADFPSHGAIILTRRCRPILASKAVYFAREDMKNRVKKIVDEEV